MVLGEYVLSLPRCVGFPANPPPRIRGEHRQLMHFQREDSLGQAETNEGEKNITQRAEVAVWPRHKLPTTFACPAAVAACMIFLPNHALQ